MGGGERGGGQKEVIAPSRAFSALNLSLFGAITTEIYFRTEKKTSSTNTQTHIHIKNI